MSWHHLNFDIGILTFCQNHGIDPDHATGKILGWLVQPSPPDRHYLTLVDTAAGVAHPDQSFVLLSPELTNKVINRTLTVRKRKQVPSGFQVRDALQYQVVCVVGQFSQQELASLHQSGIQVKHVSGATPKQISDNLAAALA